MGIADDIDEVHIAAVARRVLRGYRPNEGYWPTEYILAKRDKARRRMRSFSTPALTSPARPRSTPPAGQP